MPRASDQKAAIWCLICNNFLKSSQFALANKISLHIFCSENLTCTFKAYLLHYSLHHAAELQRDIEYQGQVQAWKFANNYYTRELKHEYLLKDISRSIQLYS